MAMLSIAPTRRVKNTATVLAENLEAPRFNSVASTLTTVLTENPENLESTKKYLELVGAADLDKAFNETMKQYETQFELESLDIQRQANIQAQDTLMRGGEGTLGKLGSGAAADLQADITSEIDDMAASAQESLVAQYSKDITTLETEYDKMMDTLLGETLVKYQENASLFGKALFEMLAENAGIKFESDTQMNQGLADLGLITQFGDTEAYEITELGQTQIANILATYETEYGEYSNRLDMLTKKMAERVMSETYPSLNPIDDADKYDEKLKALQLQFDEWLHDNSTTMYYTHLGLASMQNGNLVLNDILETPPSEYVSSTLPEVAGKGINIYTVSRENYTTIFGEKLYKGEGKNDQEEYLDNVIAGMRSGDIPSGSYFFANYKGGKGGTQLFYFENDQIYATDYSFDNLPPELDPKSLQALVGSAIFIEEMPDPKTSFDTDVHVEYTSTRKNMFGQTYKSYESSKTILPNLINDLANGKYPENAVVIFGETNKQRYIYKNGKLIKE